MVVDCPQCREKMRVDETRVPKGEKVRVKCPHCAHIAGFPDDFSDAGRSTAAVKLPDEPAFSPSPRAQSPQPSHEDPDEPAMPDDAFEKFRFPAEKASLQGPEKIGSVWKGRIRFIIISLVWTAIFALLVNLILPGPHGGGSATGPGYQAPAPASGR